MKYLESIESGLINIFTGDLLKTIQFLISILIAKGKQTNESKQHEELTTK